MHPKVPLEGTLQREAPQPEPRRPLRILMVLESNFTPQGGGGAESQVKTIALALQRMGNLVTIVTPIF